MNIIKSPKEFKILSDNLIGIPMVKEDLTQNVFPTQYNIIAWKIFNTNTLTFLPYTFDEIGPFEGNVGCVQINNKTFFINIENEDFNVITVSKEAKCLEFKDGLALMQNIDKTKFFAKIIDDKLVSISNNFEDATMPKENMARIKVDGGWTYAYINNNSVKELGVVFKEVENFHNGFGIITDEKSMKHYCCFNNGKLFVGDAYQNCFPVSENIARVVDSDGVYFGKISIADDNYPDVEISPFKYTKANEIKNGVAVAKNEDAMAVILKFKTDSIMPTPIALVSEGDTANHHVERVFMNAQNLGDGLCAVDVPKEYFRYKSNIKFYSPSILQKINSKDFCCCLGVYKEFDGRNYFNIIRKNLKNVLSYHDGVACVQYSSNNYGHIFIDNGQIVGETSDYNYVEPFFNGVAVCKLKNLMNVYVVRDGNTTRCISNLYQNCKNFEHGFGVCQDITGLYQIVDKHGLPLVKAEDLQTAIKENPEYKKYYNKQLENYQKTQQNHHFSR